MQWNSNGFKTLVEVAERFESLSKHSVSALRVADECLFSYEIP